MELHHAVKIADCPTLRIYKRKRDVIAESESKHNRRVNKLLQQEQLTNVRKQSNAKR
jgi:hypothetical protein